MREQALPFFKLSTASMLTMFGMKEAIIFCSISPKVVFHFSFIFEVEFGRFSKPDFDCSGAILNSKIKGNNVKSL